MYEEPFDRIGYSADLICRTNKKMLGLLLFLVVVQILFFALIRLEPHITTTAVFNVSGYTLCRYYRWRVHKLKEKDHLE